MIDIPGTAQAPVRKKQFYQILYVQVLFAITVGILLGHFYPQIGESMKPWAMPSSSWSR